MPDLPEVTVTATRYTVSLLPADDINHRAYALYVQRRPDGWGITDGVGWVEGPGGHWHFDYYEALTFAELDDALALARRLAPGKRVNGITAAEAYRRTDRTA
ncbi:hypothetical protein [Streptomyces sp. CC208A]|uniref:hypothetical protein n=1 Tax=Streptomyces sp. CC208A TaxID=3044573 RepID=UPI0024A992F4|nr:hypothetical protein [Streptomyces sp. CC208A]